MLVSTRSSAICWRQQPLFIFVFTSSTNSCLSLYCQRPSDASITKSIFSFIYILATYGSAETSSFCFKEKSPRALVILSMPLTLPWTIRPPTFVIRFISSSSSTEWSFDIILALLFYDIITVESPTLAKYNYFSF